LFSFPLALIFGIVGIVCDERKLLAVIATLVAAALVLFYFCVLGIAVLCR
jgi:hypothetical protein